MPTVTKFIPGSPERRGFYERMRLLARIVLPFFFHLDTQGLERLPPQGALIVASNHLSSWDIPSLALRSRRMFHYMAKSEYARNGFLRWLFIKLEAFFVRRGEGDMDAIRNALAVLSAGQVLAMYPEGHRSDDHALIHAHMGMALIALKSGAPVMPVATWGSELVGKKWRFAIRRPTIYMRYGEPMTFAPAGKRITHEELESATDQIMRAIAAMLPPRYRGVYAENAPVAASVAQATETSA